MEVILTEQIEKLGRLGDIVNVKAGFARNFLLPTGKAVRASNSNKELFKTQIKQMEARNVTQRSDAEKIAKKLKNTSITLIRQAGESGQLYGSVTKRDAALALVETGFSIDRSQLRLDKPIKTLGIHNIVVFLHPEVSVSITANVARSIEEATAQQKSGKAVLSIAQEDALNQRSAVKSEVHDYTNGTPTTPAENIFDEGASNEFIDKSAEEMTLKESGVVEETE